MDLYNILGLEVSATKEDIKKAYHKLARIHHPDKNVNNTHETFVNIQTAYEILYDDSKRQKYDNMSGDQKLKLYDVIINYFKKNEYKDIYNHILKTFNIDELKLKENFNTFNFKNIYDMFLNNIVLENQDLNKHQDLNIYGQINTNLKERYFNKFKKITVTRASTNTVNTYIIPVTESQVVIKNAGENINSKTGDVIIQVVCQDDLNFKQLDDYNLYVIKYINLYKYLYGDEITITHLDDEIIKLNFKSCLNNNNIYCIESKGLLTDDTNRANLYIYLKLNNNIHDQDTKKLIADMFNK